MNIKQIFTAIALTLCILSVAVIFTLNFRPLYYMDIHHFNLPEKTGYPEEEIRENYDSLIDYNSVFYQEALEFPTLTMSEEGRIHFVEVKRIFVFIQAVLLPLSLLGSILGILNQKKTEARLSQTDFRFNTGSPGCSRRAHRHELGPVFYSVSQIVF